MLYHERTSAGTKELSIDAKLLDERVIFIEGEITDETANGIAKALLYLDGSDPVRIFINSPGGSVTAGLAIYDMIVCSEAPIYTNCIGRAYSIAALLFIAGKRRIMLSHAELLFHEPFLESRISGSTSKVSEIAETLILSRKMISEIMEKHSNLKLTEVERLIEREKIMTAENAVHLHFADRIGSFKDML